MLFADPYEIIACDRVAGVPDALHRLDRARAAGDSVAGYIAYSALPIGAERAVDTISSQSHLNLPLVYMLVCRQPRAVSVTQFLNDQIALCEPAADNYSLRERPDLSARDEFFAAMNKIRQSLAAGEVYQINYTRNSPFEFSGNALALYARLRRLQPTDYSALIMPGNQDGRSGGAVLSLSPELFFSFEPAHSESITTSNVTASDYILETRPMKGTAPRYADPARDRAAREELARDAKSLAEHRMIVDLLRNDLGVHARPGGVTVPEALNLESHDTLHQMTSIVRGRFDPALNARLFATILPALFPSGSITGAPKRAARQMIARLENESRGVYTGAIGYATPEYARFSVAIRTLSIGAQSVGSASTARDENSTQPARYGSGCGIVWDSEPAAEWEEYRLKQAFLRPALDGFALIETMLFDRNDFTLLPEHLSRLENSARHYHIDYDHAHLSRDLTAFVARNTGLRLRVRLTLDRRGAWRLEEYDWSGEAEFARLDLNARDHNDRRDAQGGVAIRLAAERVYSGDPFRRHKTTERQMYDQELAATRAAGFADSLFLNERDEVVESTIANLLIQTPDGRWLTPAVDCGALPGVFLAGLDREFPRRIERVRLTLAAARAAGRWFLVNSLRGARPICLETDDTVDSTVR